MKKKIMIDMDDVLVNQDGWLYLVNTFLNSNYKIDDVKGYYIQDLVPKNKKDEFTKYFISKNVYDYCKLYDDSIKVIEKLSKKYDIYITTAYVFRDDILYSANSLKYKFEFLVKNFPFLDPNKFIFMSDKKLLNVDIKIDDKLSNLDNADVKLLFTAYHNKDINSKELSNSGIVRVNSWKDIEKLLLKD